MKYDSFPLKLDQVSNSDRSLIWEFLSFHIKW